MLIAFAIAVATGLAVGNPPRTVLQRALLVMAVTYVVGRIVGAIAHKAVQDYIDQYKKQNPIPTDAPSAGEEPDEENSGQTEATT